MSSVPQWLLLATGSRRCWGHRALAGDVGLWPLAAGLEVMGGLLVRVCRTWLG